MDAQLDYCRVAQANYQELELAQKPADSQQVAEKMLAYWRKVDALKEQQTFAVKALDRVAKELSNLANDAYISDRPVKAKAYADAYQVVFSEMIRLLSTDVSAQVEG
jgi:hypothetical protein